MRMTRRLAVVAVAQDRTRTRDIVGGLGAEPRTMLAGSIIDWTTNNMLEPIYDRLLDRDAETYAEIQQLIRDEAPWAFLWQQHDLCGVASQVEWTPRADEKVWMCDAKIVAK